MKPIATVVFSSHFERVMRGLPALLATEVRRREVWFRRDCFDPRLKTHKLKGRHRDLWSFSITFQHRIVFRFLTSDSVLFIDVGDHSIYQ